MYIQSQGHASADAGDARPEAVQTRPQASLSGRERVHDFMGENYILEGVFLLMMGT